MDIKIHNPSNLPTVSYKDIEPLQGDLKYLTTKNSDNLQASILLHGFNMPVSLWKDSEGKLWIIDGHQRLNVLTRMEATPQEIPYYLIHAASELEAREILLKTTSQYGTITQEGLDSFMQVSQLPEAVLPMVNYDAINVKETIDDEEDGKDGKGDAPEPESTQLVIGEIKIDIPIEIYKAWHGMMLADFSSEDAIKQEIIKRMKLDQHSDTHLKN